jgi:hypothetical protein
MEIHGLTHHKTQGFAVKEKSGPKSGHKMTGAPAESGRAEARIVDVPQGPHSPAGNSWIERFNPPDLEGLTRRLT